MIVFCYGTTAEAIKLAPVMQRLVQRGVPFEQWVTLQQADTVLGALPGLGIPTPDHVIANGRSGRALSTKIDVLVWLLRIARWAVRHRAEVRRTPRGRSVIVVHGDTMTSVVGAVIARFLGFDCAHVEAGLRSGDWKHPFPEELDRRIVGRLADVHYAPTAEAARNLAGRSNVVLTHGNTVVDAVLDRGSSYEPDEADPYGVLLLHRFEFLGNPGLVRATLQSVSENSPVRIVMVVDDLARHGMRGVLAALPTDKIQVIDKLGHAEFAPMLGRASFIVTDSGGVQEEAALLGVPTLVHRRATERGQGLGENVMLSDWSIETLERFLADHKSYRRPPQSLQTSPSDVVVSDLLERGYGS
ncbi:UDP-N-acetylglucosamine 2-epimerase [Cellulomonas chengniuliangii]|uniref:UDP-N-acetylglucosamine 2-epimerase n=1 Tax=Cellulomonas chengniuliangii TaxID=2968084 RepID=A0ABY5KVM2_9CELL|nr:UDP-N-acetylglucosamine 2-epimerase [Cellulomonas chengniuliangii]MCC2310073.1 UDP-N-acetylglucosamine 2-epimerase [Cellulomonas chengniuliangii]UUI74532.1 UDP-N-acetylglucosamine 2-epimerase [Cellulomonas chengniuliangii]